MRRSGLACAAARCDNPTLDRFAFWHVRTRDWKTFSEASVLVDDVVTAPSRRDRPAVEVALEARTDQAVTARS